jgi:hypothetical protein
VWHAHDEMPAYPRSGNERPEVGTGRLPLHRGGGEEYVSTSARLATMIGESPDEASNQAIRAALLGELARA